MSSSDKNLVYRIGLMSIGTHLCNKVVDSVLGKYVLHLPTTYRLMTKLRCQIEN